MVHGSSSVQNQVASSPLSNAGPSQQKDAKESASAPKFGDVYQQIQSKYGEKPEKAREIKKTLGKDDFLKIMITQMKNQDPTNPFKAEQMATEIAQFTTVEQLHNMNQNLTKMSTQNKPLEQMAMTNMIGKVVTIDRERFPHTEGENESLKVNLPKNAENVRLAVVSDTGDVVLEKDLGAQKAGEVSFSWDGKKTNSLPAKTGNYMLRVEAKDEKGVSIETNPQAKARIIGVSLEGTEPIFLVGDAKHQDKITLRNIVRVEVDQSQLPAGGNPEKQTLDPPTKGPNFISFQKGVGSSNFNPNSPSSATKVLENYSKGGE
jgi:flagellar basal-body rod modification protein FlgD